jgi:hypothetical protein
LPAARGGTGVSNSYSLAIPATGTAVLRSGGPTPGRVASWASSTSVGDASFAASDVYRRDQFPAFYVHKNVVHQGNITSTTWHKLTWSTEVYDTHNAFASNRFTCPADCAGIYTFKAAARIKFSAVGGQTIISIWKNNSEYVRSSLPILGGGTFAPFVVADVSLAVGDYVEVFVYQSNGVTHTVVGFTFTTFFAGARTR